MFCSYIVRSFVVLHRNEMHQFHRWLPLYKEKHLLIITQIIFSKFVVDRTIFCDNNKKYSPLGLQDYVQCSFNYSVWVYALMTNAGTAG